MWLRWVLVVARGILDLRAARGIFSCSQQTLSCGLWGLVPWLGIEPTPPALGTQSLSHWTTGEVPRVVFKVEQNINALKLLVKNSPLAQQWGDRVQQTCRRWVDSRAGGPPRPQGRVLLLLRVLSERVWYLRPRGSWVRNQRESQWHTFHWS